MTQDRAQVLDHNARLYFELDDTGKENNLYSYHSEYNDYLDERNLVDVSIQFIHLTVFKLYLICL